MPQKQKKFPVSLSTLESLLLAVGKPLSFKELSDLFDSSLAEIKDLAEQLKTKFNQKDSGIHVVINNNKIQFVSNADNTKILRAHFQDETTGELSKASLETLTIIAYRQPIAREELEQIRGVNCSIILRNLMIRGLIEVREEKADLAPMYSVTIDFVRHLGIDSVEQLPDFEKLNSNESLQQLLESTRAEEK